MADPHPRRYACKLGQACHSARRPLVIRLLELVARHSQRPGREGRARRHRQPRVQSAGRLDGLDVRRLDAALGGRQSPPAGGNESGTPGRLGFGHRRRLLIRRPA